MIKSRDYDIYLLVILSLDSKISSLFKNLIFSDLIVKHRIKLNSLWYLNNYKMYQREEKNKILKKGNLRINIMIHIQL